MRLDESFQNTMKLYDTPYIVRDTMNDGLVRTRPDKFLRDSISKRDSSKKRDSTMTRHDEFLRDSISKRDSSKFRDSKWLLDGNHHDRTKLSSSLVFFF